MKAAHVPQWSTAEKTPQLFGKERNRREKPNTQAKTKVMDYKM